jgi:poly(hydroxyalkanoate) granule-associated protein
MSKVVEEIQVEEMQENVEQNRLLLLTRKVFLVGLGAVAMTQDGLSALAKKLLEQGEATEKQTRQRINSMVENRKKETQKTTKQAKKEVDKRLVATLHYMNVPTTSDINKLSTKVAQLNKKVDELKKTPA